jgi:penicillin-binding protein 1A
MGLFSRQLPSGRRKRTSLKRLMVVVPLYAAAVAAVCLGGLMAYYSFIYPDPLTLRSKANAPYVRILARDGSVLTERGGGDDYMPFDLLPPYVADAVIATEDQRFYDHHGVDPVGMIRAAIINLREGRTVGRIDADPAARQEPVSQPRPHVLP